MTVHVEVSGSGPEIVAIHGWGLHGGLFAPLADRLSKRFRVHLVDLPGHGHSPWPGSRSVPRRDADSELNVWTDAILDAVPERSTWLGWSLGATVAMYAALEHPHRVDRLVVIAATPKFVAVPDWPHAQAQETLTRFADGLASDFRATIDEFLTLQSLGDENARARIKGLRARVFDHGEPDPAALAAGLAILRDTDLRSRLEYIAVPLLALAGARDRLTPPQATAAIADSVPGARYRSFARAAHAPFLNDPGAVAEAIEAFAGVG